METNWSNKDLTAVFVAGLDWNFFDTARLTSQRLPVINLIQGLRHAEPDCPLYRYLRRPAIRICVSPEVARAIQSTGEVNGPVFVIPNGIDTASLPFPNNPIFSGCLYFG